MTRSELPEASDLLGRIRAEIAARMRELRAAVGEQERLLEAAGALEQSGREAAGPECQAASPPAPRTRKPARSGARKPRKAPARGDGPTETERAILAALEHGSHTLGELGMVTAISASELRGGLRALLGSKAITRATRESRAAYALSSSPTG